MTAFQSKTASALAIVAHNSNTTTIQEVTQIRKNKLIGLAER
jgi:hypothetical protein